MTEPQTPPLEAQIAVTLSTLVYEKEDAPADEQRQAMSQRLENELLPTGGHWRIVRG